jgi:hypothetical protein
MVILDGWSKELNSFLLDACWVCPFQPFVSMFRDCLSLCVTLSDMWVAFLWRWTITIYILLWDKPIAFCPLLGWNQPIFFSQAYQAVFCNLDVTVFTQQLANYQVPCCFINIHPLTISYRVLSRTCIKWLSILLYFNYHTGAVKFVVQLLKTSLGWKWKDSWRSGMGKQWQTPE